MSDYKNINDIYKDISDFYLEELTHAACQHFACEAYKLGRFKSYVESTRPKSESIELLKRYRDLLDIDQPIVNLVYQLRDILKDTITYLDRPTFVDIKHVGYISIDKDLDLNFSRIRDWVDDELPDGEYQLYVVQHPEELKESEIKTLAESFDSSELPTTDKIKKLIKYYYDRTELFV